MKEVKNKRGIIKGRNVTITHSGKPWATKNKKTTGRIYQVTDYFFAVKTDKNYCECFLLVDVFLGIVQVKINR